MMEIIIKIENEFYQNIVKKYLDLNKTTYYMTNEFDEILTRLGLLKRTVLIFELGNNESELIEKLFEYKQINRFCQIILLSDSGKYKIVQKLINISLIDGIIFYSENIDDFYESLELLLRKLDDSLINIKSITDNKSILRDILSTEYVYDLIYGHTERIKFLKYISSIMGLDKEPQIAITISCDNFWNISERLNNKERYNLKRLLLNNTRNFLDREYKFVASSLIGTDKIIVLLDCSPYVNDDAKEYALKCSIHLKEYIKEHTPYTVTIGISNYISGYKNLWCAYDQSFKAVNQSFIKGDNNIIQFSEIDLRNSIDYKEKINEFEQKIIMSISLIESKVCIDYFIEMCNYLIDSNINENEIKSVVSKVLNTVTQYCSDIGLNYIEVSKRLIDVVIGIFGSNFYTDMQEIGSEYIVKLSNDIFNVFNEDIEASISIAKAYINKYYYLELNQTDIAKMCNLSKFHFSRTFKEYSGKTYKDFVTDLRIEAAKKLLTESEYRINEIGEKVGYKDIYYFSRIFKKKVGTSPNIFRKKLQSKKTQK